MAKKKFTPILTDLALLTPEQQNQYIIDVCEFLEVPAELGLIRVGPMDSGDGARKTVLYVQKGATDIIRDRRGINVDEMTQITAPDIAGWNVKGHDKNGRTEIAVGTVSTKGLSGKMYADAFMFAQTKACRRLTLQFAGGGFLDESEVTEKTSNLANSSISLKEIAQPKAAPNAGAGKDITPASAPTPATTPSSVPPIEAAAPAAEEPKKRRGRKRKTDADLDSPGDSKPKSESTVSQSVVAPSPSEKSQAELEPLPESKPLIEALPVTHTLVEPKTETPAKDVEELPFVGTRPSIEQKDDFRKRFSLYVNKTLPEAGFLQSETLGGRNDKLKLFVGKMFPKLTNFKTLSVEQWSHFLEFMDTRSKTPEAAAELVKFIDKTIGEVPNA